MASALEGIPVLGLLSQGLVFEWVEESYKKGAYINGVYKETIDGITFEITEIVGDKDNLRFEYEIKSNKKINDVNFRSYAYGIHGNSLNYDEEYNNIQEKLVKLFEEEHLLKSSETYSSYKYINVKKERAQLRERMLEIEKEILEEQLGFLEEEKKHIYEIENNKYFVQRIGTYTDHSIKEERNYFYLSLMENKDYIKKKEIK